MEIEMPMLIAIVLVAIWIAHRVLNPNDSASKSTRSSFSHDSDDYTTGLTFSLRDRDGDGIPDFLDPDDDNDGIPDAFDFDHDTDY